VKIVHLNNALELQDVDLYDDEQCREVGRIVAQECVVYIKQSVSEERLHSIQMLWGQPTKAVLHRYVGERHLGGKHWRSLLVNLSRASKGVDHIANQDGMSRVSFVKDKRGNPTGLFTNGELDWHSDRQSIKDSQSVVGLMSLWGTKNSQTTFLNTAPAYDDLNHEDKSMVDELVTVWEWDGGEMGGDMLPEQKEIIRYSAFPLPDMECSLTEKTATGRKGFRFPTHSFGCFKGMSKVESEKTRRYLWSLIHQPKHVYTRNWEDGEIMFMDQNITLHARPTNVVDGDKRTLSRMITYLDKLFPEHAPLDYIDYKGVRYSHDEFAAMADDYRREIFYSSAPEQGQTMVRI
jgi:alpha-ketoglutarate-dependent taurine dioxygenase